MCVYVCHVACSFVYHVEDGCAKGACSRVCEKEAAVVAGTKVVTQEANVERKKDAPRPGIEPGPST